MNDVKARAAELPVDKLRPFEGHPFHVKDDEEMDRLVYSVLTQGLLTPIVVRPLENEEYEVISGHRRLWACQKAGIQTVPALIYALDRDEAAIALVDSNLHRERILPSEKAFAYKLKMEALSHQGTSSQIGTKLRSDEMIAQQSGDSRNQVQRYIRLTNLIPEILAMVDDGKIALTPAVELSYLTKQEQRNLLETMESEDCTPSLSQAQQLKKMSQCGLLDMDKTLELLQQPKGNQKEKISLNYEEIRRFFPKHYTPQDVIGAIMRILEADYKRRQRKKSAER